MIFLISGEEKFDELWVLFFFIVNPVYSHWYSISLQIYIIFPVLPHWYGKIYKFA